MPDVIVSNCCLQCLDLDLEDCILVYKIGVKSTEERRVVYNDLEMPYHLISRLKGQNPNNIEEKKDYHTMMLSCNLF